jgi:pheromone shutdown-related protein TraB
VTTTLNLRIGHTDITVLGTAHISRKSAAQVQLQINSRVYDAVAIELCDTRFEAITHPKAMTNMGLNKVVSEKRVSAVIAQLLISGFQRRLARENNIEAGLDMTTAIQTAGHHGLPVIPIDRGVGITLRRILSRLSLWKKLGMAVNFLYNTIFPEPISETEINQLVAKDSVESTMSQFAKQSDDLYDTLIRERDQYMATMLKKAASSGRYRHILAVVGAGHIEGIEKYLVDGPADDHGLEQLNTVPAPKHIFRMLSWLIVVLILAGFVGGFMKSPAIGTEMLLYWIFLNGSLAAAGTLIAAAHPFTILTTFLSAPLTSLNPAIGAGMVAAGVELHLREPQVGDFETIRDDTLSLRGWWRNRVTRILLLFMLSSTGSAIGTYLAGLKILGLAF